MRPYVVFVLLVGMAGGLAALRLSRESVPHEVTVRPEGEAAAAGKGDPGNKEPAGKAGQAPVKPDPKTPVAGAKTPGPQAKTGAAPGAKPGGDARAPKPAAPTKPLMERPLRVASLGWELIAPGVVANNGAEGGKDSLFDKERLPVALKAFGTVDEVEAALARGGADKLGADVAILPLPSFVAAYERLRALKLQIFFVVGWSRGRDGLMALPSIDLRRPPRDRRVNLVGQAGHPATFLSLYALDLAGVSPRRVRLITPEDTKAKQAPFAAGVRPLPTGATEERKFVVTTADATHLIPMVAVAPEGFTRSHKQALTAWGHIWLSGVERLQQDVPGAARQVAELDQAPHALDLLKSLGQIDPAPLSDNARLVALSGRSAATLERLFRLCWQIWREAGVLSSPMPDAAPISVQIMTSAVRSYPAQAVVAATPGGGALDAMQGLLVYQSDARRWDEQEHIERFGFIAEVFSRAGLKISVRGDWRRARGLVEAIRSRYDLLRPDRIVPVKRAGGQLVAAELFTRQ